MASGGFWCRQKSKPAKDARVEYFATVLAATLPIWFFPFFAAFTAGLDHASKLLAHSLSEGELFLLSTALIGPIIFILFKGYHPQGEEDVGAGQYALAVKFPHGFKLAVGSGLVVLISACAFGFQKVNPTFASVPINGTGYLILSVITFLLASVCFFLAMFFRNEVESGSVSSIMRQQEDDFSADFDKARS